MDLNNDGNEDIISGSWPGEIYIFEGKGGRAFEAGKVLLGKLAREDKYTQYGYSLLQAAAVHAADWDGDGDLDLIAGEIFGKLYFIPNETRDGEYGFGAPVMLSEGRFGKVRFSKAGPHAADWDGDGDLDLVVGVESGGVFLLRNTGSREKPELEEPVPVLFNDRPFEEGYYRLKPFLTDWNGDGIPDMLVGSCISEKNEEGKRSTHGYVWLCTGKAPAKATVKSGRE